MKEMGTGTLRGAEESSRYTEEDGWEGTKPDSGRQRAFPVGQARSSAPYLIITCPSPQKEWKRNSGYPHFPDEEAEAQGHTAVRRQAVGRRPAGLNEQRAYQGFGDRLFGTRVPPLEARGRVPRAYSSGLQFCSPRTAGPGEAFLFCSFSSVS